MAKSVWRKLKKIITQYQLPLNYQQEQLPTNVFQEKLLTAIAVDKKNLKQQLNLVLLKEVGQSFLHKIKSEQAELFLR